MGFRIFNGIFSHQSDTPRSTEDILQTYLPDDLWQSLPAYVHQRLQNSSDIYRQMQESGIKARSEKHLLWEIAAELVHHAHADLEAAEVLAAQALQVDGDVIDECLARTVLIKIYAEQPEREADYERLCLETIERVNDFDKSWRDLQQPESEDSPIEVPRLDAFEHLIRLYHRRGDAAAMQDILNRAYEAGYDDLVKKYTSTYNDRSSRQSILLLLAIFGIGTLTAANNLMQTASTQASLITALTLTSLLSVNVALLLSAELRTMLLVLPRFLRRYPWLVWLILLEGLLLWGYQWEILRETPLQRNYTAWALLWGLSLLLFAGMTDAEQRLMAAKLARSRVTGIMITLTTIVLIFIGAEFALRHVVTFSNSYAIGLNHQRWQEQHELPQLNALEYRDYPIERNISPETQRILVAGDSFAAGFGINDIADTFPHLLDDLPGNYTVHVAAKPGWETEAVLDGIQNYPVRPDILIYSYFLNDIFYLDEDRPDRFIEIFEEPPPVIKPLVDNFYLPELLYWNVYRQALNEGDNRYGNIITELYADDELWNAHTDDLLRLIAWTEANDTKLIIVVWPVLTQIDETELITRRIQAFFEEREISVVNMVDSVKGKNPADLVVNPFDMHPNEALHQIAASQIYQKLLAEGMIFASE